MPEAVPDVGASEARPGPAHGPALGITHRLFGRFHVTGVFWYRFHYFGATTLPWWAMRLGLVLFTTFFFLVLGRIRSAIVSNLEPVLGRAGVWAGWRRAYRTLHAFAWCQTDRYRRSALPEQVHFTLEGEEHWRAATAGGRGAILVTAHIGAWELGAQLGATEGRRRVHVVREEEIDPRAQAFIRELVTRVGEDYVTHFASDDMRLTLVLREALDRGEIVALQGDRPRTGSRTVPATIFGKPMTLPAGPAVLARLADVPLVPVFNFREGPLTTRTVVRPPVHVATTCDRDEAIAEATRRIAAEIEWAIRERPYQWFCFRELWPG